MEGVAFASRICTAIEERRTLRRMARNKSPALYELYGSVPTRTAAQPRRELRIAPWAPIALIAVAVLLFVGAFLLGVSRGERVGRAEAQAERDELLSRVDQSGGGFVNSPQQASANEGSPEQPVGTAATSAGSTGSNRYPPVDPELDPREVGKLYLTVCTVPTENAPKVANFLREQGLEAFVVPCNTARSREVIVLPGFSDRGDSGAIERLKDRVRTVGLIWKQTTRDTRGFSDCYAKPFSGRS